MEIEDRWQAIPISYRDRVYGLFNSLPFDEPYIIANRISPENQTAFKVIVAYFIRWSEGDHLGFRIEFSNDFSKIKKFKVYPKQTQDGKVD